MAISLLELARQQRVLEGVCSLSEMPRLAQALRELGVEQGIELTAVQADYHLQGVAPRYFSDAALPVVRLQIKADLPAACQRCFAAMPLTYDLVFEYAVCNDPPEALVEDESMDWLEPDGVESVAALVEDELLMALPIAVMHDTDCVHLKIEAGEKPNPFAVLKQLKTSK